LRRFCQARRSLAHLSTPFLFLFRNPATTSISTLSLHDALPIFPAAAVARTRAVLFRARPPGGGKGGNRRPALAFSRPFLPSFPRSEEHTSELQSRSDLVCPLLLEKKKREQGARQYLVDAMVAQA